MSKENQELLQDVLNNKAEPKTAECMCCDSCGERVLFHMRDKYHDFTIGLTDILQCLEFAILDGDLPQLPQSWSTQVESSYNIEFECEAIDFT